MSYYSEIVLLKKNNTGNTFFTFDNFTQVDISDENVVWTEVSDINIKIIDNVQKCCINKSSKSCVTDFNNLYKEKIIKNIATLSTGQKTYTTEDYDISLFANGYITEENQLLSAIISTRVIYLENIYTSMAKVLIPGISDDTELNLNLNGIIIGKIIFLKNNVSGTINIFSRIQVSPGDVLSVTSTDKFDSSCENFTITIVGKSEKVE